MTAIERVEDLELSLLLVPGNIRGGTRIGDGGAVIPATSYRSLKPRGQER
jgi:hypothetical protein